MAERGVFAVRKSLVAALVLGLAGAVPASAGVEWHTTDIDLGFIYRDEPQNMSFGFVNTSDETLFIYDIEPSCDCTTAQAIPPAVPPHNSGKIYAFFDPAGYEGKGKVTEYIRLATSDPDDPEAELHFSVEVGIGPEPSPRALNFGSICKGDSDTLDLVIQPGSEGGLKILGVESGSECVKIVPAGANKNGAQEFRVIVCNLDCRGAISSYINLRTADAVRETVRVPVTANLMGTIVIEPEVIAFGPTLPGSEIAQPVRIRCTEGQKFRIEKVTCTAPSVACSVTLGEGNIYELKMKIKEDAPAGKVTGQIVVETDCGTQPLVTAKIAGFVRSANK
jgi:hypothetical protein